MDKPDRRVRRTRESLHKALISLALEKHYDSITVQEVLDRADIGRSTFYTHFQSMEELLISGMQELRTTLSSALENQRKSAKRRENVIAFSRAMFDHAYGYRNVYFALLNTGAWPIVRQQLQEVLEELIRRECKAEIAKFVCSLPYFGFLCSVDLVDGPPQPVDTVTNRRRISLLGAPNATRGSWVGRNYAEPRRLQR